MPRAGNAHRVRRVSLLPCAARYRFCRAGPGSGPGCPGRQRARSSPFEKGELGGALRGSILQPVSAEAVCGSHRLLRDPSVSFADSSPYAGELGRASGPKILHAFSAGTIPGGAGKQRHPPHSVRVACPGIPAEDPSRVFRGNDTGRRRETTTSAALRASCPPGHPGRRPFTHFPRERYRAAQGSGISAALRASCLPGHPGHKLFTHWGQTKGRKCVIILGPVAF